MAVHPFCIDSIICFSNSSFLHWLLVIQHVKLWCNCFWVFLFGVWCIFDLVFCFVCLFVVLSVCCLNALFWYYILMVMLIGHSACEALVSLFMGFSFGVWCVFDLVLLLSFVGPCSVCSFFGCIVLVVFPFCIDYWSVSTGTIDVIVFGVFIWCVVSFRSCFVENFFVGHCSVCSFFGCIILVVCPFCRM